MEGEMKFNQNEISYCNEIFSVYMRFHFQNDRNEKRPEMIFRNVNIFISGEMNSM